MYAMPTATAPACKTRFAAPTGVSPACLIPAIALNLPSSPRLESRCPLMPVSATFALLSVQRIPRIALATDLIRQRGPATRAEKKRDRLPGPSYNLTEEQRYDKVGNLLRKMRKDGAVSFDRSSSRWHLA